MSYRSMGLLVWLASCTINANVLAQDIQPKVGLVLSGGGAKGLAHIGVLKAMESIGIYPDCITGTSMGSIVGGLYALGYSAQEIEDLAIEADWGVLLNNRIAFDDIAFEEKAYYGRYAVELPVKEGKVQLPSGVLESQNLNTFFDELTSGAHSIDNFDDLPIPYRCVGTDIETGKKVVLKSGSLVEAMRASMAIPSIFTPVEIDGKLLVDGGLVRNFPVEEAIEMGADIIIGVFVSDDLSPKEELNTLTSILMQSAWVMSAYDAREQKKLVDLYVEPDLKPFSSASFSEAKRIIASGDRAGDSALPALQKLHDSLTQLGKVFEEPRKLAPKAEYPITSISVTGNETITTGLIRTKLEIEEGSSVNTATIALGIRRLHGTRLFQRVHYRLVPDDDGYELKVEVNEKPQIHLQTAIHYDNEVRSGINFNLIARNILGRDSRTLLEMDLAENLAGEANYLKYLGPQRQRALTVGYRYLSTEIPLFENDEQSALFDLRRNNLFAGLQSTNHATRTAGARVDIFLDRFKPVIASQERILRKGREASVSATAFWSLNTLDRVVFPSKGMVAHLEAGYIFYNQSDIELDTVDRPLIEDLPELFEAERFIQMQAGLNHYFNLAPALSAYYLLEALYASEEGTGVRGVQGIGGFFNNYAFTQPFWGAKFNEFQVASYGLFAVGLQWEVFNSLYLTGQVNYVNSEYPLRWIDPDRDFFDLDDGPEVIGGGVGLHYNSIVGPLSLVVGKASHTSRVRVGFNLGFWL